MACQGAAALADYDSDAPGCSYTYHQSSAGQPGEKFGASLAVEWTIAYRTSAGDGTFPTITTATPVPLGVAEIQAIVTKDG